MVTSGGGGREPRWWDKEGCQRCKLLGNVPGLGQEGRFIDVVNEVAWELKREKAESVPES